MNTITANIQPLTRENFDFMRELLYQETAIALADGKEYLVETRLTSIATRHGYGSVNELVAHFRTRPAATPGTPLFEAYDALTTNETLFFRDINPFNSLRDHIIPEIAAQNPGRPISIWSAACSTGQEAYSVAMLFAEHFPDIAFRILGTDISNAVLKKAEAGTYHQHEVNRGLPAKLLIKHFRQQAGLWQLNADIRSRVKFSHLNLARKWATLPRFDIILMRNVLIYFDTATRRAILEQVRSHLLPKGYVSLGGSESTMNIDDKLKPTVVDKSTFYRVV